MLFNIELFDYYTDLIEHYVDVINTWTSSHQELLKLLAGIVILLYSPRLSCTILLMNCMKGIGLPLLQKSWDELCKCYRDTKNAIKTEGPTLANELEKATKLTSDLREIEKTFKTITDGNVSADILKKVKTDIEDLAAVSQSAIETSSRIRSKLDYTALYRVIGNLYMLTLTAVATARTATAANLSIGISIGNSITSNLKNLIKKYEDKIYAEAKKLDDKLESSDDISQRIAGALFNPEQLIDNLNAAATFIGAAVGMALSFYYTAFGRLLAAATLGAEIVVNSSEILLDPILVTWGLPTVNTHAVILRSGLTYFGILYNGYCLLHGYGTLANLILSPLLVVEVAACKIVADSVQY